MVHFEGAPWELTAPVTLSLVCFRHAPPGMDEAALAAWNATIMARVNDGGRALLGHTRVEGRYMLRLAIGNLRTGRAHVEGAWQALRAAAAGGP
jgi:aromatic-L-amino-acid decarboxylase